MLSTDTPPKRLEASFIPGWRASCSAGHLSGRPCIWQDDEDGGTACMDIPLSGHGVLHMRREEPDHWTVACTYAKELRRVVAVAAAPSPFIPGNVEIVLAAADSSLWHYTYDTQRRTASWEGKFIQREMIRPPSTTSSPAMATSPMLDVVRFDMSELSESSEMSLELPECISSEFDYDNEQQEQEQERPGSKRKRGKKRFSTSLSMVVFKSALHLEVTLKEGGAVHYWSDTEGVWRKTEPYATSLGVVTDVGSCTIPQLNREGEKEETLELLLLTKYGNLIHYRCTGVEHEESLDGGGQSASGDKLSLESLGIVISKVRGFGISQMNERGCPQIEAVSKADGLIHLWYNQRNDRWHVVHPYAQDLGSDIGSPAILKSGGYFVFTIKQGALHQYKLNNRGQDFVKQPVQVVQDNTRRTLSKDLTSLIDDPVTSDVVIEVDQRKIFAHSAILAARSEYFRSLLFGGFRETGSKTIVIDDAGYDVVMKMLEFLYTDDFIYPTNPAPVASLRKSSDPFTCRQLPREMLASLILLADRYSINSLLTKCCSMQQSNCT